MMVKIFANCKYVTFCQFENIVLQKMFIGVIQL